MKKGKSYACQQGRPWLTKGQVVVVQPVAFAAKPYLCIVQERIQNWHDEGPTMELCTMIPWKTGSVIWPYWAEMISKASRKQSIWFYVVWFFRGTRRVNKSS
jgi:hypothetical protein